MSSYIIAGSADSTDTVYCEQIARRIKAKYKNIDFRIVIKHPSEWEEYLQQICRIYGFLNKSNPIVYTFDGKIIGNKDAFMASASKYFGLEEASLLVPDISNKVNMKLAEEELQRKKIVKNNIKTMNQKIQVCYQSLLKRKILRHQLQPKEEFLHKGIQFVYREVPGMIPNMVFPKDKRVDIVVQDIKPDDIDLMALSLNDQIKPDEPAKDAFVTTNQNQQLDEKMSEASKTNKLHQSMLSYDNNSKGVKQSSSKHKSRIDQQFDDVADFIDQDMQQLCICDIGQNFCLAFEKNTHIQGQMVIYHNQDSNGNVMRVYNDGRPVKGHKILINESPTQQIPQTLNIPNEQIPQSKQSIELQDKKEESNPKQTNQEEEEQTPIGDTPSGDTPSGVTPSGGPIKKTEEIHEVPVNEKTDVNTGDKKQQQQQNKMQILSERGSELNLVSNLNYHTLYISQPLSLLEIQTVLNLLKQTNCIACLQFLPENPNPRVKVYHRLFLTGDRNGSLPVQRFIDKQIEEEQYDTIELGSNSQQSCTSRVLCIKQMGFKHLYYPHIETQLNEQLLGRVIKVAVESLLEEEEIVRRDIGYNLIIAKSYTLLVPLVNPYKKYNNIDLYLDGLAYLGLIHLAKVTEPYKNTERNSILEKKQLIKQYLASSTGYLPDQ